jgi:hypothetical protein
LAFIRRSRDLGFTLEEIRALLALGGPERAPCAEVHKIASAHLASVRNKLSDLVKLESILAETVAQCSNGATPDCPVLDILDILPSWPDTGVKGGPKLVASPAA